MSIQYRIPSRQVARRAWRSALAGSLIVATSGCGGRAPVAVLAGGKLTLQSSGLLISDDFQTPASIDSVQREFELNGSAPPADRTGSVEADGLHVGVRAHRAGTWEGFFAVTRKAYPVTSVFHVHMARSPVGVASPAQSGEAVFAVQTGTTKQTGDINYVLVASLTTGGKTHWLVGYAEGHIANAKTTVLWQSPPSGKGDLAEDISLRTNGSSSLEVYFGEKLVYSSHGLTMHIAPPFQPYLEVQSLGIAYDAVFAHLWIAADSSIMVQGLLPSEQVALNPTGGRIIRAAPVSSSEAQLQLALPAAHGTGVLSFQRSHGQLFSTPVTYTGGDIYRSRGP
jgi:hypothetical protein